MILRSPSASIILPCLGLLFGACVSRDEVARATSPDGQIDAVLVETNGGATTDFGYDVFLTIHRRSADRGMRVASLYGAIRSDSAYGANLHWTAPEVLLIEYDSVRGVPWVDSQPDFDKTRFQVRLRPGIVDSTAPGGGMLLNLEKRRRTS